MISFLGIYCLNQHFSAILCLPELRGGGGGGGDNELISEIPHSRVGVWES